VFAPVSIRVGFVVDKVALGQVFPRVLRLSPVSVIPPSFSILIYRPGDEQYVQYVCIACIFTLIIESTLEEGLRYSSLLLPRNGNGTVAYPVELRAAGVSPTSASGGRESVKT
jgi:hypothetical protein